MGDITWLHLSDFHFRTEKSPNTSKVEPYNQKLVLDSLLADIEEYPARNDLKVDFVIITGDIAYFGQDHEYAEAEKFLDRLLGVAKLDKNRLFVVPGNHDIDRNKVSKRSPLILRSRDDINGFLSEDGEKEIAFRKFDCYKDFVNRYFNGHLSFDYRSNYFWVRELATAGGKIAIIGLNSAWYSREDGEERKLPIGEKQICDAVSKVNKSDLTIAAFHHPPDWLRRDEQYDDERLVMRELGKICQFILHGHMHVSGYEKRANPDFQIQIIPAGACYEGRDYRNACNYVKFNPATNKGELHLRFYADTLKKWTPDNETFENNKDGICSFNLNPPSFQIDPEQDIALHIPEKYRNWIDTRCQKMDVDRLVGSEDKALISLTLPDIFIPLYGTPPGDRKRKRPRKQKMEEEQFLEEEQYLEEEQHTNDIEKFVARNDHLLLVGQAGSGKTTLIKHLAYTIIHGNNENGLKGYLPVLLFLKDLSALDINLSNVIPGTPTAERILLEYFKATGSCMSLELVKAFSRAGKLVFLFDGLDEIDRKTRDVFVTSLANLKADYNNVHKNDNGLIMVLSSRPHGIDSRVNDCFGDKRLDVYSLHMGQVKLFIEKWHKFDTELQEKGVTPFRMFEDIRKHPKIKELITTPLMLTAACILYHYEKKLPEQRAELYEKFIKNLLYKRFEKPAVAQDFLMKLAFAVHDIKKRDFTKSFAIQLLAAENPIKDDESDRQYTLRLEKEFDLIDENCGLLKLENGQYSFWHLSFQEFLAARDIAVHQTQHAEAIKSYWDDEWYEEVIYLLVGHLSNSSRAIALEIVENELKKTHFSPFRHWRVAAKAFSNIQIYSNKDIQVLKKIQDRLVSIFEMEIDPIVLADSGETLGWLGDPRDLKEFLSIEGGEYELQGMRKYLFSNFEIAKYPVTNQWYEEFIKSGGYDNPTFWSPNLREWLSRVKEELLNLHDQGPKCPNLPVVNLSCFEAEAFCRWVAASRNDGYLYRLPTEQEWQLAAAGKDNREYPWGKRRKNVCNTEEIGIKKPTAVGIFKQGTTPEGIADLSGNIWEWTYSHFGLSNLTLMDGSTSIVLKGGSCRSSSESATCSSKVSFPWIRNAVTGFRCARIKK